MKSVVNIVTVVVLLSAGQLVHAQIDTTFQKRTLPFADYLSLVGQNNLLYAAEKFNVNIAEAGIEIAKVFPNPQLYYGYFDNGQRRMDMGYGYAVNASTTIELGGKRRARMDLASDYTELSKALLENYFRNLRADATLSYLNAIKLKNILDVKLSSYKNIGRLASSDSIRFKLGSIMEIDARQSKVEAGSLLNALYQSESDWKIALASLGLILGKREADTLYYPVGSLPTFERDFKLAELLTTAQNNRADLLAALKNKNVAKSALKLAKANRMIDLGIVIGSSNASVVTNFVAPTPSFTQVSGGVFIPLKFSNNYKGELKIANYTIQQAELQYRQVELQVQTEVTQAYYNYLALSKQVKQFQSGLLVESKKVLDGKVYSYQRGKTSLLEVLNAQRTYNEIRQNYFEALYNYSASLVELERAVGIWDINF
ncbi:MAG: TolC family protein [Bacteroidetes bacterium]|nr:TolC family protein [Bacteroidota bacterium]